jgi:uncharacterized protein with von Willebrand factor type A (vWA) domain
MFNDLFFTLRQYGVPVSTRELLDLNRAVAQGLAFASRDEFYHLTRLTMVKDERYFDKFDRAMAHYFEDINALNTDELLAQMHSLPPDWLQREIEKNLTDEERAALAKADNLDELMRQLAERLREQHKRHQGGNKMIGTGGTSPFGAWGEHLQGVRIGGPARKGRATKIWEQRQYRNLDDGQTLGVRQMQVVLRRLRRMARTGAAEELDMDGTIQETARQGMLDVRLQAERRNRMHVLLLFDVGGSMDRHVQWCEQFFTAVKSEFKTMSFYYFHNCIYDYVWKDNARHHDSRISTTELLRTYDENWRVIVVGDASMAPYELLSEHGAIDYMSGIAGIAWLRQIRSHFKKSAWLNPEEELYWQHTLTLQVIKDEVFEQQMYPFTQKGLEDMARHLSR